jgi:hypothetical protein
MMVYNISKIIFVTKILPFFPTISTLSPPLPALKEPLVQIRYKEQDQQIPQK